MDYHKAINDVIDYIEDRLFDKNVYETAISYMHISKFHFHRIFLASTLHTLGDYIKKRRFTVIANRLRNTKDKIIDIALDCNYESHEAFSRAFKNYFCVTPSGYRNSDKVNSLLLIPPISQDFISVIKDSYQVVPTIEYLESLKLMGFFFETSLQNHNLQDCFKQFLEYVQVHSLEIKSECAYAVWLSDKTDAKELIDNEEYSVFVGAILDDGSYPELREIIIENMLYATFMIEKNFQYIKEIYKYIYFEWLVKNDYELENAPIIEKYSRNFSIQFHSGCMWILVPVKKKQ